MNIFETIESQFDEENCETEPINLPARRRKARIIISRARHQHTK